MLWKTIWECKYKIYFKSCSARHLEQFVMYCIETLKHLRSETVTGLVKTCQLGSFPCLHSAIVHYLWNMQWGTREMVGCACSWLLHYKGNQLLTFSLSLVILLQAHQQSMRWNELLRNVARQQCTTSNCVFDVLICVSVKFHISCNLNCWHLSAVSCFPNPHSH